VRRGGKGAEARRTDAEAQARHTAALLKYGSEERALAPCLRERELHSAGALLLVRGSGAPTLMRWNGGPARTLPPEVRREIGGAVRLPADVAGTWAEFRHWQRRAEIRAAFRPDEEVPLWIKARVALLEERLDTLPARDRHDVLARLDWMAAAGDPGASRSAEDDAACLATLHQDIENGAVPLRERAPELDEASALDELSAQPQAPAEPPNAATGGPSAPEPKPPGGPAPGGIDPGAAPASVQLGQPSRTREEAREAVRALLAENKDLPDREIARRVGVSPSTVAAVRKTVQRSNSLP
jgi:hypothetical protein